MDEGLTYRNLYVEDIGIGRYLVQAENPITSIRLMKHSWVTAIFTKIPYSQSLTRKATKSELVAGYDSAQFSIIHCSAVV